MTQGATEAELNRSRLPLPARPLPAFRDLTGRPVLLVLDHPCRFDRKGLLFGKHEGVYWVPQHLRGDPERGTVISDYEIGETS